MEPNFQTSFIPKKPMIEERVAIKRPTGALTVISVFLLIASIAATGGLYFYKQLLSKNITQMASDLNLAKNRFEPARIAELQVLDKRLRASNDILSKHVAMSPIFQLLQDTTLPTIRFSNFTYSLDETNTKVQVKMRGVAVGYRSIALQGDLYTQNKNFIDPVFSNLTLDDKGNVTFDLAFTVEATFVDYKAILENAGKTGTDTSGMTTPVPVPVPVPLPYPVTSPTTIPIPIPSGIINPPPLN